MRVVINTNGKGLFLSREACNELLINYSLMTGAYSDFDRRNSPELIKVVEKLGRKALDYGGEPQIVEVKDCYSIKWFKDREVIK